MNDRELSELECLIAATRPAGPSEELDARVRQALSAGPTSLPHPRERRRDRMRTLAVAASLLVAAGIGFLSGRLTADSGNSASDPVAALPIAGSPDVAQEKTDANAAMSRKPVTQTTVIPLPEDRLAGLFMPTRSREGLLGVGPVTVEVSGVP